MADTTKDSHPSEDQKKAIYENLSPEQKKKQTYTEWVKDAYNNQYEHWMPWIEDKYLAWFGTDNKASYATKVRFSFPYSFAFALSLPSSSILLSRIRSHPLPSNDIRIASADMLL